MWIGFWSVLWGRLVSSQCVNELPKHKMLWFYAVCGLKYPYILCFKLHRKIPIFRRKKNLGDLTFPKFVLDYSQVFRKAEPKNKK